MSWKVINIDWNNLDNNSVQSLKFACQQLHIDTRKMTKKKDYIKGIDNYRMENPEYSMENRNRSPSPMYQNRYSRSPSPIPEPTFSMKNVFQNGQQNSLYLNQAPSSIFSKLSAPPTPSVQRYSPKTSLFSRPSPYSPHPPLMPSGKRKFLEYSSSVSPHESSNSHFQKQLRQTFRTIAIFMISVILFLLCLYILWLLFE